MAHATKKVLIVEDDKDFLWLLMQSFENQGLSMVYAVNGEEGLAIAEREKPDLMIIDIMLPKMDGITMARAIKEKEIKSKIIFLTNLKDSQHIAEALDAVGQTDYMIKSDVHIEDVLKKVKSKLGV